MEVETGSGFEALKDDDPDCGDAEDAVTLAALRAHFKTPAWKDLGDESSALSRFLLSAAFKTEGLPPDQISCSALRIYAMLTC